MRGLLARGRTVLVCATLLFSSIGRGVGKPDAAATPSILVKVLTKDAHVYVGELTSESDDSLTLCDLNTGHDRIIGKKDVLRLDRDLSDDAAVAASDLPSVLLWK